VTATARYVFDSFALLAFLGDEPGAGHVRDMMARSQSQTATIFLSVINFGECLYIVEREQGFNMAHLALAAIDHLPIEIVPATRERVLAAAHLKARHRFAYADAFTAALAQEYHAVVVTGDPEFKNLEPLIPIFWLPHR
jgi:predicted nucleic acid-binding protein